MHKPHLIPIEKLDKELFSDPTFAADYAALEPEFAVIKAMIDFRTRHGLSQEELASKTGMKQSAISRLESGRCKPSIKSLFRLAEGLGAKLEIKFVPKN